MAVGVSRPAASELVFHLFGRSVHPELFNVCAETSIQHEVYSATICLCENGHIVSFRCGEHTVTEVLVDAGHVLPEQKRLFGRKIRGSRNESRVFSDGLRYQTCSQLEVLDQEVFHQTHEELAYDCLKADLSFRFAPGNRLAPAPLSLIRIDARSDGLLLHIFHTFPECRSVIRIQSLFEP